MGCGKEVLAARDERHTLQSIVHDDSQMVARGQLFAGENNVAQRFRPGLLAAGFAIGSTARLLEGQDAAYLFEGLRRVETKRIRRTGCHPLRPDFGREVAANARVPRAIGTKLGGLRCNPGAGDFGGDFFARAETGIEQILAAQGLKGRRIVGKMLGLPPHRHVPSYPKPGEILKNCIFKFRTAAGEIDVFDAQEETSALPRGGIECGQRRTGVPEMQKSGWTWSKASDNHGFTNLTGNAAMNTMDGPRVAPKRLPATHLVVLCHGYGSDGNDLIGLVPHWQDALPTAAFSSPNAPERCTMAGAGYQWFPLSRLDPQETLRGTEAAAPKLNAFLDAELSRLNLTGDKLALVGFSQGTMMSLSVGLRRNPAPAAIVGFSGLLAGAETLPRMEKAPPVLLIHGDSDQVIPPQALFMSANALGGAGVPVQWHMSKGLGHGIDPVGLALAGQFLSAAFSGKAVATGPVATPFAR